MMGGKTRRKKLLLPKQSKNLGFFCEICSEVGLLRYRMDN